MSQDEKQVAFSQLALQGLHVERKELKAWIINHDDQHYDRQKQIEDFQRIWTVLEMHDDGDESITFDEFDAGMTHLELFCTISFWRIISLLFEKSTFILSLLLLVEPVADICEDLNSVEMKLLCTLLGAIGILSTDAMVIMKEIMLHRRAYQCFMRDLFQAILVDLREKTMRGHFSVKHSHSQDSFLRLTIPNSPSASERSLDGKSIKLESLPEEQTDRSTSPVASSAKNSLKSSFGIANEDSN